MAREAVDVEIQGEGRPEGQVEGPGAVPGPRAEGPEASLEVPVEQQERRLRMIAYSRCSRS